MKTFFVLLFSLTKLLLYGQVQYALGETELTEDKEQSIVFTSFIENQIQKLPDSIDLSNLMPPAGDQGAKGSCWAWATTYVVRSVMDNPKKYTKDNVLDSNTVYSPEYVYQYYKGNKEDCNWGAYSYDMLDKILKDGVVKYSDFSYSEKACNNQPEQLLRDKAKLYAKPGFIVDKLNDLYSIRKVLAQGQSLVISIKVDDFFCTKGNINSVSPFWNTYNTRKGSHAMVVVGYNDSLKAVKVLNSWGQKFGDKGYVWISYSIINSAMNYCCYPKKTAIESINLTKVTKEEAKSGIAWPSKRLSAWFKKGYYQVFENLRIGLAGFSKKNEFAVVDIRDNEGNLKTSFYIDIKTTKEFYVEGKKYQFTFENIGNPGINPFSKAVYFTILHSNL